MSVAGLVLLDLGGLAFIVWTLNQVRKGRLYVGYGVLFLVVTVTSLVVVTVPLGRHYTGRVLASLYPDGGWLVIAVGGLVLLALYTLTQVTIVSNRLATLAQELALQRAAAELEQVVERGASPAEPPPG